jgi:flavin reductase (DIM6/NTAB) family NADH-FMN oxidoreductase RutF
MSEILGPTQVALITASGEIDYFGKKAARSEVDMVLWHCAVSVEDRKYAIVVGNNKPILSLIIKSGVFIVNFIPSSMSDVAEKIRNLAPTESNIIQKLGLSTEEGDGVDAPRLKDAMAYIDCNVSETKRFADYTLIIANIIKTNLKFKSSRLFHLDDGNYTTTKEY